MIKLSTAQQYMSQCCYQLLHRTVMSNTPDINHTIQSCLDRFEWSAWTMTNTQLNAETNHMWTMYKMLVLPHLCRIDHVCRSRTAGFFITRWAETQMQCIDWPLLGNVTCIWDCVHPQDPYTCNTWRAAGMYGFGQIPCSIWSTRAASSVFVRTGRLYIAVMCNKFTQVEMGPVQ